MRLVESAGKMEAAQVLRDLILAAPYRIHTVLTDNRWAAGHRSDLQRRHGQQAVNGVQFTNRAKDRYAFVHIFDRVGDGHGIEHRPTKVNHPSRFS